MTGVGGGRGGRLARAGLLSFLFSGRREAESKHPSSFIVFVLAQPVCGAAGWPLGVRAPVCVISLGSKEKMHENVFRRPGDRTHASYDHDQESWGWDLWGSWDCVPRDLSPPWRLLVNAPGTKLDTGREEVP